MLANKLSKLCKVALLRQNLASKLRLGHLTIKMWWNRAVESEQVVVIIAMVASAEHSRQEDFDLDNIVDVSLLCNSSVHHQQYWSEAALTLNQMSISLSIYPWSYRYLNPIGVDMNFNKSG